MGVRIYSSPLSFLTKGTGLTKGAENYIWSDTHFLEKREMSYVGCSRSINVSVARPCGSKNRFLVCQKRRPMSLSRKGTV